MGDRPAYAHGLQPALPSGARHAPAGEERFFFLRRIVLRHKGTRNQCEKLKNKGGQADVCKGTVRAEPNTCTEEYQGEGGNLHTINTVEKRTDRHAVKLMRNKVFF